MLRLKKTTGIRKKPKMEKMNNDKIVITGMGAVTPIGIGVDAYE